MKKLFLIFLASFLFRFLISFVVWHPDVRNHMDWGIRFFQYGPDKFFAPESNVWNFTWPNQPPGTIYMFAGIRKLFEAIFAGFWWLNIRIPAFPSGIITFFESNLYPALLKLPAILADIGIAWLIYKFITAFKKTAKSDLADELNADMSSSFGGNRGFKSAEDAINHQSLIIKNKEKVARLGAIFFLINPAVWYNSTVWGQYDSVINFLALLAFYLLLKRKLTFSLLAFSLSLYTKASLLIFLPIFIIVAWRQKYKISQYLSAITYTLLPIALLTLPFSRGEPFSWLFNLYQNKVFVQQLHVITANAFNLWAGLTGTHEQPEGLPFLGLTYRLWGLILFAAAYIPTLYLVYKKQNVKSVMWALAISAFSSFMLLTNMHERYLYPLFAPLTILAVTSQVNLLNYRAAASSAYWVIGLISLLNLYTLWWVPRLQPLIDLMSIGNRFVPRILGFVNFGLFVVIYRRFLRLLRTSQLQ